MASQSSPPLPRPGWTITLTSVAFFMVSLDVLVVVTALPSIHRDLGASLTILQWTVNAYTLAYAASITTAAALGDRYGRRKLFALGLVLFTAASAACALSPGSGVLIGARVIQGMGAGVIMPLSLTILTTAFPPERRGAIIGIWGGIAGIAVASGSLVGGAVTQGLDWHWIFWVNVSVGVMAAGLAFRRLPESFGPPTRLDLLAVLLVSLGAVGIVLGLVRASDLGWGSTETLVTLSVGLALMACFVVWEHRAETPMLPLRLFRSLTFSAGSTTAFFMAGALTASAFLVAQYFQLALGYSPLETGVRVLPWTATPLFIAPIAGALSDRVGRRTLLVLGMFLTAVGSAWVGAVATTGAEYWGVVIPLVIAGIGISMVLPVAPAAVLSAVAPQDMGKASGVTVRCNASAAPLGSRWRPQCSLLTAVWQHQPASRPGSGRLRPQLLSCQCSEHSPPWASESPDRSPRVKSARSVALPPWLAPPFRWSGRWRDGAGGRDTSRQPRGPCLATLGSAVG